MTGLIYALASLAALCGVMAWLQKSRGWLRAAVAIGVWPIALYSIIARDLWFDGQIHVWPFLLAACALAAVVNPWAAIPMALAVGLAQGAEQSLVNPMGVQLAVFTILGVICSTAFDKVAATAMAIVSLIYAAALFGFGWREAMIVAEVVIVLGLFLGVLVGPDGGIGARIRGLFTPLLNRGRGVDLAGMARGLAQNTGGAERNSTVHR